MYIYIYICIYVYISNSVQFNSIEFDSIRFNTIRFHSIQTIQFNSIMWALADAPALADTLAQVAAFQLRAADLALIDVSTNDIKDMEAMIDKTIKQ